jgi:hypothetical protein
MGLDIETDISSYSLLEEVRVITKEAAKFTQYDKLSVFERCVLFIDSRIRYSAAHPRVYAQAVTTPLCRIAFCNIMPITDIYSDVNRALVNQLHEHYSALGFIVIVFYDSQYIDIQWSK